MFPAERIYQEIKEQYPDIKKVDMQTIDIDALEWLGFFYSKWHFITEEPSTLILRTLKPKDGLKRFYLLHQIDEHYAIEMCKRYYNLDRNLPRAYQNKKKDVMEIYLSKLQCQFLNLKILYKLNKDSTLLNLDYVNNNDTYTFINEDEHFIIKSDALLDEDDKDISSIYIESEKKLYRERIYTKKAIFIFNILQKQFKNEEIINSEIEKMKEYRFKNGKSYDYVYLYIFNKLYEINSLNELYVYDISFSSRDTSWANNKIKENDLDK